MGCDRNRISHPEKKKRSGNTPASAGASPAVSRASRDTLWARSRFWRGTGASRKRPGLIPNETEPKAAVVAAAIEGPATGEAGGGATEWASSRKVSLAMGAGVKIAASLTAERERQIVAARFALNSQVGTGPPPFHPVGRNPPAAGPKLSEQVRQFMAQRSVNLSLAVSGETAVKENAAGAIFRATGGGAKTSRPLNANLRGQAGRALLEEEVAGQGFERRIAPRRFFSSGRCE